MSTHAGNEFGLFALILQSWMAAETGFMVAAAALVISLTCDERNFRSGAHDERYLVKEGIIARLVAAPRMFVDLFEAVSLSCRRVPGVASEPIEPSCKHITVLFMAPAVVNDNLSNEFTVTKLTWTAPAESVAPHRCVVTAIHE